jgi:DNA-directed RNA polymerase specialized sigma24 family protein
LSEPGERLPGQIVLVLDLLRSHKPAAVGAAAVRAALDALPAPRRERFDATYFGGVTHEQVARILSRFHPPMPQAA